MKKLADKPQFKKEISKVEIEGLIKMSEQKSFNLIFDKETMGYETLSFIGDERKYRFQSDELFEVADFSDNYELIDYLAVSESGEGILVTIDQDENRHYYKMG